MGSKLISIGCSFTCHNTYPGLTYWDVLLADYLNLTLHNYSRSGTGGDYHMFLLSKAIADYGKDIDTIVIGWSGWDRFSYPYSSGPDYIIPPNHSKQKGHMYEGFVNLKNWNRFLLTEYCIKSTYAQMYMATKMADAIGAKLIILQLLRPLTDVDRWSKNYDRNYKHIKGLFDIMNKEKRQDSDKMFQAIYNSTEDYNVYHELSKDERLVGFPFLREVGGEYVWTRDIRQYDDIIVGEDQLKESWVSDDGVPKLVKKIQIDQHPNQKGHELIFNRFKEAYDNLYK